MDVIGEIVSAWIQLEIDRIENSGFRRVAGANQAIHPRRWGVRIPLKLRISI